MALLTVQTMIDKAARRCGQIPELLSTELTQALRENLFLLFAHNASRGLQLWKVDKYRHGINNGQVIYTLPDRSERILNVNYVTGDLVSLTPTGANQWPTSNGQTQCQVVGVKLPAASTLVIKVQYSLDGTTWVDSATVPTTSAGWSYVSIPVQITATWRVAAFISLLPGTSTPANFPANTTVNMYSLVSEIPMAPLNRDDYWNLPNKEFQANRPLQYWFDRQNTLNPVGGSLGPQVRYWPVGNDETVHVNMLIHSRINDVMSVKLDQQIDVPERWLHYIQARFAAEAAIELPNVPLDRASMLEQKANKLEMEIGDDETDDAPIYFTPNIGHYTR